MSADAWRPDWPAIADHVVNRTMKVQPGERVVYLADPAVQPDFLDEVRLAVLKAGAIEQATMLNWTPRLIPARAALATPAALEVERQAHLELMQTADVFMWLPSDFKRRGAYTRLESEWILARWKGRGLHFHWFEDLAYPSDHPIQQELERIYQRAILELDYAAHAARQQRVVDAIRGKQLRVTTPDGTDVTFRCPAEGWYCRNDGDGSKERKASARTARDREEEMPCGVVRTVPDPDSVEGTIGLRRVPGWNGFGLDLTKFGDDLDIVFRRGHIAELRSRTHQQEVDAARSLLHGDWDRLGEIVFGTNPLLPTPAGATLPTYWGFGEGVFRFHFGENWESGGAFEANLWINLWLTDTTVEAGGETIVRAGKLLL